MMELHNIQLPQSLRAALQAARERISEKFHVDRIVLFGSVVRGQADEESDVDLLIMLRECPDHKIRNQISRMILDVNLEYDVNISGLVVDQQAWDRGPLSVLPIHEEIDEEGIRL